MSLKKLNILFYTAVPRLFHTTSSGYLYELAKVHNVILLSEELDEKTQKLVEDKNIFPGISEIIPVRQFTGEKKSWFLKNRELCRLAKSVIGTYKPDVVIVENDVYPFEMYLLRFAKRAGALRLAVQVALKFGSKETMQYFGLSKAYGMPMPLPLAKLLVKLKMYAGHAYFYWILPLTVFQLPFLGSTSLTTWNHTTGKRGIDANLIFFEPYKEMLIREGVLAKRIFLLPHPLLSKAREFFQTYFFVKNNQQKDKKVITISWRPVATSIRKDASFITKEAFFANMGTILKIAVEAMPDWQIAITTHPNMTDAYFEEIRNFAASISRNIIMLDPRVTAEECIEQSDVLLIPAPASTIMLTALYKNSGVIIVSTDFENDMRGDFFKNTSGVEYIDEPNALSVLLQKIAGGAFTKSEAPAIEYAGSPIVELIEKLT